MSVWLCVLLKNATDFDLQYQLALPCMLALYKACLRNGLPSVLWRHYADACVLLQ